MNGSLQIANVCFTYPDGHRALEGVSFSLEPGECVALIGPNGAGKSTLLLHLNGLLRGRGRIVVSGLELGRHTLSEIRRRVGLVFQDPDDQLFLPTCLEDVQFGPLNEGLSWQDARERAMEALRSVGMEGHAERPPHHLSLGQRKRVALATVLAMRPDILAFDEPSAGLDPAARRQVMGIIRELPQTRLVATHDLLLAEELCSRVLLMDGGRIVADGTARDILQDAPLLLAHSLEPPGYVP